MIKDFSQFHFEREKIRPATFTQIRQLVAKHFPCADLVELEQISAACEPAITICACDLAIASLECLKHDMELVRQGALSEYYSDVRSTPPKDLFVKVEGE